MSVTTRTGAAIAALLLNISAISAAGVNHPPLAAYAQLPESHTSVLAPDGKHMATIRPYDGRPAAVIYDLEKDDAEPVIIPFKDGFIERVRWARNNRLLVTISAHKAMKGDSVETWTRLVAVDSDGHNAVSMMHNLHDRQYNTNASIVVDLALNEPDTIYMTLASLNPVTGAVTDSLYAVNLKNGEGTRRVEGKPRANHFVSEGHVTFFMDGNGQPLARVDGDNKPPYGEHVMAFHNNEWQEIYSYIPKDAVTTGVAGVSESGDSLVMLGENPQRKYYSSLYDLSLKDGKRTLREQDPQMSVDGVIYDPWTSRVIGIGNDRGEALYFDKNLQNLNKSISAAFKGMDVNLSTWDEERKHIVVSAVGPSMPRSYFLLDRVSHKAERIATTYPQISPADNGEVKAYDYTARDGLTIPAFLTLPPGKKAKTLPFVILPHGGPMSHDEAQFNWMVQFFANRGYGVLQPNFRGSDGYGKKFEEAGYGQWGLKMQDDITDGVKKLIADGIADPKRICIVGGSYGGYAALAGAAFTPDLYACAAGWAGVYDLRQFLKTRAKDYGRDSRMVDSWSHYIGDRSNDADKLDATSPALNATKIKVPVLLMHGTDDTTVRIDQSEEMASALKTAGKKVTYIPIKGETHYFETAESRAQFLSETEKFLKENIGN